jgi:hypothetical protein
MPRTKSTPHHISELDHRTGGGRGTTPSRTGSRTGGVSPPPPSPALDPAAAPEAVPEDLSVLPVARSPLVYRLQVSRRSFDTYTEEFTRVIADGDAETWAEAMTDLYAHLTTCREYNDSMLGPRGRCDVVHDMLDDSIHPAFTWTRGAIAFKDLPAYLKEGPASSGLGVQGPRPLALSMGSSHHNAPQWSIQCAVEDRATAVTLTALRVIPDWPNNYQVTEHFADIRAAIRFLSNNYDPDGRKVAVTLPGSEEPVTTDLLAPFAFMEYEYARDPATTPSNPYAFYDTAPLPLRMRFPEGIATVTVEITRTWA